MSTPNIGMFFILRRGGFRIHKLVHARSALNAGRSKIDPDAGRRIDGLNFNSQRVQSAV